MLSKIVLLNEKPLFIASSFQNIDEYDDLEVSKAINNQSSEVSSKEPNRIITYTTTTDSPDAYILSGRYEVRDEEIAIKINIRQRRERFPKYWFEVRNKKNNMKVVTENIVQKQSNG